ncbi:MAG: hypothetical protein E6R03_09475 [Hyphomicrobiaceae bacterium]|nr:MAG: hypothetical protein E6R03_09475 [Hyphomicrobiaceae bacterium]
MADAMFSVYDDCGEDYGLYSLATALFWFAPEGGDLATTLANLAVGESAYVDLEEDEGEIRYILTRVEAE